MKRYTKEQSEWLRENAGAKVWKDMKEFTDSFNLTFNESRTKNHINDYLTKHKVALTSNNRLTAEQKQWITDNARIIEWRNTKHFADTFNALFGTSKTATTMNSYLNRRGIQLRCPKTTDHYTDEMRAWLIKNYAEYECDFVSMAKDFNNKFSKDYSSVRLAKYCARHLKIHIPKKKGRNKGCFETGKRNKSAVGLPIGTIRHNSDGRPFIKVLESDGGSGKLSGYKGHNYKEPWWKPLQKKIWEDHYGEVPEGYLVCSLNGNPNDTDIRNIGIIDKRGTVRMAKHGWWTDNRVITGDGVQ